MELDVSGLVCPQPAAIVRRCLVELEAGEELVVTGDYPPAKRSIRRSCYKHGFAVEEGPPTDDGEFSLRIVVTESATLGEDTPDRPTSTESDVDTTEESAETVEE